MRIFVTGGSGVLGRATIPHLERQGHDVVAPPRSELDLFDRKAVEAAVVGADAVFHLATRIPPREAADAPNAWNENDRLRAEASRLLVDAALHGGADIYVQPSVTFVYRGGPADENTSVADVPRFLESALAAEREALRFGSHGRIGIVLRLGALDGPSTGRDAPDGDADATLHVEDAGRALATSLAIPGGIYNVCRDGERVSNARFKRASGWRPEQ